MNPSTPHQYVKAGQRAGVPLDVLRASIRQASSTIACGAAPILTLRHLAQLAGAPYFYLREIVQRDCDPYSDVILSKAAGGTRAISAPDPVLMDVQRLILRRALSELPLHPFSYAYTKGRSVQQCAEQHLGSKWMIKFDLHDFFGQIDERDVFRVFVSRGYSRLMSFELARICTRLTTAGGLAVSAGRYKSISSYEATGFGQLPQGAPTSGALSNMVATPLDHEMTALAVREGFTYTRYSDDMVLSTSVEEFDRAFARSIIAEVRAIVDSHRLTLHEKKTRVVPPGARHVVLGLLVDGDSLRLTPEFRRRVEVHIRGVDRFGITEHATHRRFESVFSFINHVEGCLNFARSVQPEWADIRYEQWLRALRKHRFPC